MQTTTAIAGRFVLVLVVVVVVVVVCLFVAAPPTARAQVPGGAPAAGNVVPPPAPGDGVGGVEVGIRKHPGGGLVTLRANMGGGFSFPALQPGSYTVVISFKDPRLKGSTYKSFYESRSNYITNERGPASGAVRSDWVAFNEFPYSYFLSGVNVARAGETIVNTGDTVEIKLEIEVGGTVATTIQGDIRSRPETLGTWTNWFDRDDPSGKGDYEMLKDLIDGKIVCAAPRGIECRAVSGDKNWSETQRVYHCDLAAGGYCINQEQVGGKSCVDYKVRYICP